MKSSLTQEGLHLEGFLIIIEDLEKFAFIRVRGYY